MQHMHLLTNGAIARMLDNDTAFQPTLQVLDVKKIVTGQSGLRFRLVLSDGLFYLQGMLASQCTDLVNASDLRKFSVIRLKEFVCNNINGKKICVVIQCEVVSQLGGGIGAPANALQTNPAQMQASMSSSAQQAPQQQQQPPAAAHAQQHGAAQGRMNPMAQNQNRPAPPSNQQAFHQRNAAPNYFSQAQPHGQGMGSEDSIQPVSSLNPYQNSWKIKVRCTQKENFKYYHNQKGEGKLFGLDFLDKDGTEIRAVAFNEAAEKFFPIFEKNGVYLISKGQVRLARKGFSHVKNDYSITLNMDAQVIPVHHDNNEIETQKYKFVQIADIQRVEPKSFVDVIGVVMDVGPITTILSSKTQKELKRRNLKIADQTAKIDITLWSADAESFDEEKLNQRENTILAFKGCKVSEFGGRSLSASGFIDFHPDRPETRQLLAWLSSNGGNIQNAQLTELTTGARTVSQNAQRLTFGEAKDMDLGMKANRKDAAFFTVVASITTVAQSTDRKPWYEANPDQNSDAKNAKVTPAGDGKWLCEKNGKTYNSYLPRYILRFCATDFTGNIWLTAFNENAEKILGKTAVEAENLLNTDSNAYEEIFKAVQFKKFVFTCKAYSDVWEDSQRVRYDVHAVAPCDPGQESEKLIEKIQLLQNLKLNSGIP